MFGFWSESLLLLLLCTKHARAHHTQSHEKTRAQQQLKQQQEYIPGARHTRIYTHDASERDFYASRATYE